MHCKVYEANKEETKINVVYQYNVNNDKIHLEDQILAFHSENSQQF
jgi:hypothetical protein